MGEGRTRHPLYRAVLDDHNLGVLLRLQGEPLRSGPAAGEPRWSGADWPSTPERAGWPLGLGEEWADGHRWAGIRSHRRCT